MSGNGARQLVLEIAPGPAFGHDDYLVSSCNETAFRLIEAWPHWPDPTLLLVGPHGSGKSHLAAIWARAAGAQIARPSEVHGAPLSGGVNVVVEDADTHLNEAALFHLVNRVREQGGSLLLTASRPPEAWPVRLPDLLSRMRRATRAELGMPDEDLVRAVLVKLLVDRQLLVDTGVVEFLARHIARSLGVAREVIRRLDVEALASGRRITRGLAADVLRVVEEEEAQ